MDILVSIILGIMGLGVLWLVVQTAVLSALKEHSIWRLAGGAEATVTKRARPGGPQGPTQRLLS